MPRTSYSLSMNLTYVKVTASALWIFAVGWAGAIANVSTSSWIVLAGCAVVPPLLVVRYWKYPDQTMSESIQRALR